MWWGECFEDIIPPTELVLVVILWNGRRYITEPSGMDHFPVAIARGNPRARYGPLGTFYWHISYIYEAHTLCTRVQGWKWGFGDQKTTWRLKEDKSGEIQPFDLDPWKHPIYCHSKEYLLVCRTKPILVPTKTLIPDLALRVITSIHPSYTYVAFHLF